MKARIIVTRFNREDLEAIQKLAEGLGLTDLPMDDQIQGLTGKWITYVTEATCGWYMKHVLKLQSQFTAEGTGGVVEPIRVIIEIQE